MQKNLSIFEKIIKNIFKFKVINHYELNLEDGEVSDINAYSVRESFIHKIYDSLDSLEDGFKKKISEYFGEGKISSFKFRFRVKHHLVASILDEKLFSFCFFAANPYRFSLFTLKAYEMYFYDCFTFPEYRGKGAIYSEVNYVIQKYKNLGYKKVHVEIEQTNIPSIKAFSKLGFEHSKTYYCISIFSFCVKRY